MNNSRTQVFESVGREVVIVVVVSLFLFALDMLGTLGPVKRVVEGPLVWLESRAVVLVRLSKRPVEAASYMINGPAKVEDLQARLNERIVDYQELVKLKQENERMRELLGVKLSPSWKFLPAEVVGIGADELVLAVGEADGVEAGMSVIYENMYVGRVSEVGNAVSEVVPVTSVRSSVSAKVLGKQVSGVVKGGEELVFDKLLQESLVVPGEIVETDGVDGVAPGLVVGRVVEVQGAGSEVYKRARLQGMFELGQLDTVFVVVGK